jgi:membrane protein
MWTAPTSARLDSRCAAVSLPGKTGTEEWMVGSGVLRRVAAALVRARRRVGWLDHIVRAGMRYDAADGGRLSAAITYYGFFAVFSLALLGFAMLGYILDNPAVLATVQHYLSQNLPRLDTNALRDARGTAGLVAFLILPVAGLFWVDALRSSIRAIWRLPQYPGNFVARQLIDLAILAGLGLLLAASLTAAVGSEIGLRWLLVDVAGAGGVPSQWLLAVVGFALGVAVNTVLAIAVLTAVPRIRMRLHRALGPALLVAAGLEILKSVGRLYIQRTEANPAYQVVTGAVGLLVFLNVLNQLLLFAATLTATSTAGPVTDLSAGPPPATPHRPHRPYPALPRRLQDRLRGWVKFRKTTRVTDSNKQIVMSFFNAISAGRIEAAFAMVADDVTWWVPGELPVSGTKTKDQYRTVLATNQAEFPTTITFHVQGLTAEDDRVAAEVVATGDHTNGKRYNNHCHALFTIRNGQIVAVNEYMDTKHLHDLIA